MTDKHERHGRHILEQARVPCWSSFHWIGGEFEDERLYYKRINVNCIVCRLWYGWKRSYLRGGDGKGRAQHQGGTDSGKAFEREMIWLSRHEACYVYDSRDRIIECRESRAVFK